MTTEEIKEAAERFGDTYDRDGNGTQMAWAFQSGAEWAETQTKKNQSKNTTLNERQLQCMETCMGSCRNSAYPLLGLCEEVAELVEKMLAAVNWDEQDANRINLMLQAHMTAFKNEGLLLGKIAKQLRHGVIPAPFTYDILSDPCGDILIEEHKAIIKEIGDVEWNLNVFANNIGAKMQEVANMNYSKLQERKQNNQIDGKGDETRTSID